MFNIFKRRSTIHLDCFTAIPNLDNLFPLIPAAEELPGWWKNLKPTTKYENIDRGTMKTCPGVADYFRSGFLIPSWRDFHIQLDKGYPIVKPDGQADVHHPSQWGTALDGYAHFKLISPWRIQEKTGVNFLFTNAFWHKHNHQMFVPNGIVNYKYQSTTNVNMVVNKNNFPNNFSIDAGDPLVHCLPVSDQNIKLHLHVVDSTEYMKLETYHFSFAGNYYKNKKQIDKNSK
jgi:hypothetical protein